MPRPHANRTHLQQAAGRHRRSLRADRPFRPPVSALTSQPNQGTCRECQPRPRPELAKEPDAARARAVQGVETPIDARRRSSSCSNGGGRARGDASARRDLGRAGAWCVRCRRGSLLGLAAAWCSLRRGDDAAGNRRSLFDRSGESTFCGSSRAVSLGSPSRRYHGSWGVWRTRDMRSSSPHGLSELSMTRAAGMSLRSPRVRRPESGRCASLGRRSTRSSSYCATDQPCPASRRSS